MQVERTGLPLRPERCLLRPLLAASDSIDADLLPSGPAAFAFLPALLRLPSCCFRPASIAAIISSVRLSPRARGTVGAQQLGLGLRLLDCVCKASRSFFFVFSVSVSVSVSRYRVYALIVSAKLTHSPEPCVSTVFVAKGTAFAQCFHCLRGQGHCLCPVFPLSSWLRG